MTANPPSIAADGRHRYHVRIYYEDTDAGGVVYHATYLRLAERARTEALRDAGIPHAELVARFGAMFLVRRVEVDYLRPARPDDALWIETEVRQVRAASVELRQVVHGAEGRCAELRVRLACVRLSDTRPGPIPPRWREALNAMRDARRHETTDGQAGTQTG